ncbi:MAG: SagB/ThcOx family dehydrogenase [Prevotellaceae bacterium]|jgi:SagB-type dehydrogenase family enzyme|nr:SagB/ThcOx family dehydrogenase [Prevotellaceae bacterium]
MKKNLVLCIMLGFAVVLQAQDIKLNAPEKRGGKTVLEALNERHSERAFVKKTMPAQTLSNLLWAANGFNRDDKRTAPTAMNRQEMELYVVFDNAAYFYDAKKNVLQRVVDGDVRNALGQPNITNNAALSIVMVADLNKSAIEHARISAGFISQNIYLYAASEGLGTVARGSFKGDELAKALRLSEKQAVILVQPVGFLK